MNFSIHFVVVLLLLCCCLLTIYFSNHYLFRLSGAFFGKHCNGGLHQFKYTAPMRKSDIFTSYTNPKWPWLVGVYRFKHGKSFPDEFDTVRLKIPERTGSAGRHIVQYIW